MTFQAEILSTETSDFLKLMIFLKLFNSFSFYIISFAVTFQSPDGKYLACGAIDGIVNVFDIATGKLIHTLEGKRWCSKYIQQCYSEVDRFNVRYMYRILP